ncbi:hypothetical protein ACIQPQ_36400 [Streptomyces sp. NPDC091281]|uniref:hypothetical protein n=1 Tax=Streptomyces sp. NPDC091281 TaxID=3365985 RepID=UPI0037FD4EE4
MDPIVLAAGTALVGAMATDAWQQARAAVVDLWRRVHADQADGVGSELDAVHTRILTAREAADDATEQALVGAWRLRLQQLLEADPSLAQDLRRLLDEHLVPALPREEASQVPSVVMRAETHDTSRVYMAGRDVHIDER